MTLVELVVALALVGFMVAVVALTLPQRARDSENEILDSLRTLRARAIRTAAPTVWTDGSVTVRFRPDGSSSGGTVATERDTLVIDRLNGAIRVKR